MKHRSGRARRCLLLAISALGLTITGHVRIAAIVTTAGEAARPAERVPSLREQAYMDALKKMGLPADSDNAGTRK